MRSVTTQAFITYSLDEELSVVNLTDRQALPKLQVASCLICCAIRKSTLLVDFRVTTVFSHSGSYLNVIISLTKLFFLQHKATLFSYSLQGWSERNPLSYLQCILNNLLLVNNLDYEHQSHHSNCMNHLMRTFIISLFVHRKHILFMNYQVWHHLDSF